MSGAFRPIASYGFIGNLGSCALVNLDGSIDWCCLPKLDSPSIFGALLDPEKGGCFSIRAIDHPKEVKQAYLPHTNILRTETVLAVGRLAITDWFHMGTFSHGEEEHHRLPVFYRHVQALQGNVALAVRFDPRLNYGRTPTRLRQVERGVAATGDECSVTLRTDVPFTIADGAEARFSLTPGKGTTFICTYGTLEEKDLPDAHTSLEQTRTYWETWVRDCQSGVCPSIDTWNEEAIRSSLVLKILSGGDGIAAAATTSLPEILGGKDNWDYRFSWIRDTSFTMQALTAMGHLHDAREFLDWLCATMTEERHPSDLRVLYPLRGDTLFPEEELPHLRGYADSRPVRIGNAAAEQRQLDIYGELLETVFRSEHLHPDVEHRLTGVLQRIVQYVCMVWQEPDDGIWELRSGPQHYVYSKVMCWVALDRGIRLAEEHRWNVDLPHWKKEREALRRMILEQGYSEKRRCFVQAFGSEHIDATALLLPLLEFLPPDHPYARSSLATIQRELAVGPLVYRSDEHHGKEGAFGFCSFWLVDALALAGRKEEATENFLALLKLANHVGLYAEEIDPTTGMFLGNFPQAFTHVGLINSALYLSRAQVQTPSPQPLMGEKHMPGGEA